MSSHSESHGESHGNAGGHAHEDHTAHYLKIYGILVVLFIISVVGPELGIRPLTLFTAFGIAVIKAFLVLKHFMHADVEKPFIRQLIAVVLGLMFVFFFGVSPDVMHHFGMNWSNEGARNTPHEVEHHAEGEAAPAAAEAAPAAGH